MSDSTFNVAYGAGGERFQALNVQRLNASSFAVQSTATEVLLIAQHYVPIADRSIGQIVNSPVLQAIGLLTMSPAVAKELMALLAHIVSNHEERYGVLDTGFSLSGDVSPLSQPRDLMSKA